MSTHRAQTAAKVIAAFAHLGVTGIASDSRQIQAGMIFAAYPGESGDGRRYIAAAIAAGALAVVWEAADFVWPHEFAHVPNIAVVDLRDALGDIAASVYGNASADMWIIGVTGTNGKTSCTQWIAQALNQLARKTAIIGTLGNGIPPDLHYTGNTTPDATLLHAALRAYRGADAQAVAMEVSSHGLDQGRVHGVQFDVAVLTNFTQDHLDYHGDMTSYAAAKSKLFNWSGLRYAILNIDDELGRQLATQTAAKVVSYGFGAADVHGSDLQLSLAGLSMQVDTPWGNGRLTSALLGRFNAHNLLASLAVLLVSDVSFADALRTLGQSHAVAGRMQTLGGGNQPLVVVDYAHTSDALEKVLQTLRELNPAGQLWCVFGCGGDRDVGKRLLMGAAASRYADTCVLTSDNPRSEDPLAIIAAIQAGMNGQESVIADRAQAINHAIEQAQAGDIVLIAGKGHEDYQEIAGVRQPFSDVAVAQAALQARGA
ncbi:MAG: UDP-N-acetylmuramoyl-L-alanyl-D-glutamate--2,6-diaminopimelate ligase [Sulfuriferula sp.]|nr:UDP-N-acetylmuramoyl-L-alanyl-D-glutamate--2,6-diaminopimelate ligase [Sulfuriferula sp.]